MKKHTYPHFTIVLVVLSMLLSSCGSFKTDDFTARKYTNFDNRQQAHIDFKKQQPENLYAGAHVNSLSSTEISLQKMQKESFLEKVSLNSNEFKISKKELRREVKSHFKTLERKARFSEYTKSVKKSVIKSKSAAPSEDSQFWLEVILAIIIPPLGVYIHEKDINDKFWISLLLTVLFWLPGAIYAILVVTETI